MQARRDAEMEDPGFWRLMEVATRLVGLNARPNVQWPVWLLGNEVVGFIHVDALMVTHTAPYHHHFPGQEILKWKLRLWREDDGRRCKSQSHWT